MRMPPMINAANVDDSLAIDILENAIFNLGMAENVENQTLCLVAAMKHGLDALKREQKRKAERTKEQRDGE